MVYVLNIEGKPLMPTTRYASVRRWLRDGLAKVYSTCHLATNKVAWAEFHIDLCFNIGQWEYATTPEEVIEKNGINIHTISFLGVARMKAGVFPQPRPKDIVDIKLIADYLGIDPATGQPIKVKVKKGKRR